MFKILSSFPDVRQMLKTGKWQTAKKDYPA
jgi:hypothetical protein